MITITVKLDNKTEMASVFDTEGNGMEGNFWDFHNGCHGMYELDKFRGVEGLVTVLSRMHQENGEDVDVVYKKVPYCPATGFPPDEQPILQQS